jgi:hypothetical protein
VNVSGLAFCIVGAAATGVNAYADVPRPTGSSLIPLQHSPQWQWLAARLARSEFSAHEQGLWRKFISLVAASEARQSIFEFLTFWLLERVWLGTMDCRGLWPRSDGVKLSR